MHSITKTPLTLVEWNDEDLCVRDPVPPDDSDGAFGNGHKVFQGPNL